MFAIAFDLDVHDTALNHPKSLIQAYKDIRNVLKQHGFEWRQGSVYTCDKEDLANLFDAMTALKALPWFPASVRDIRGFRVEQWSDFTPSMKRPKP
jgi:virulence-associated protein VapD